MTNKSVVGNCYDIENNRIDVFSVVYYPFNKITTPTILGQRKQQIFNTSDNDNLGYVNVLQPEEPIYVYTWQGSTDRSLVIRDSYKRIPYTNDSVHISDFILRDDRSVTTDITYTNSDNVYLFKPNVESNLTVINVVYTIFYDINNVYESDPDGSDFQHIKTIFKTDSVFLTFKKSGTFKIQCEALTQGDEVSVISEVIVNLNDIVYDDTQQHYLEFE